MGILGWEFRWMQLLFADFCSCVAVWSTRGQADVTDEAEKAGLRG